MSEPSQVDPRDEIIAVLRESIAAQNEIIAAQTATVASLHDVLDHTRNFNARETAMQLNLLAAVTLN